MVNTINNKIEEYNRELSETNKKLQVILEETLDIIINEPKENWKFYENRYWVSWARDHNIIESYSLKQGTIEFVVQEEFINRVSPAMGTISRHKYYTMDLKEKSECYPIKQDRAEEIYKIIENKVKEK